jgi:hypothetical protein
MKSNLNIQKRFLIALLLPFIFGCAQYAKVIKPTDSDKQISIDKLQQTSHTYTIYFTDTGGYRYGNPALLFDPKNINKTIIANHWTRIDDNKKLEEIITRMKRHYKPPSVYQIVGPEGTFFGYMYASKGWIIAKTVNDTKMLVYDFPPPPSRR